jgi:hypothetical protein
VAKKDPNSAHSTVFKGVNAQQVFGKKKMDHVLRLKLNVKREKNAQ